MTQRAQTAQWASDCLDVPCPFHRRSDGPKKPSAALFRIVSACTRKRLIAPRLRTSPDPRAPLGASERLPSPRRFRYTPHTTMPRYRTEPIPLMRFCRTCEQLKNSAKDFYAPNGATPRLDCKPCENAGRYQRRQASMATDVGRERRREQWRHDKARERARSHMDPLDLAAADAAVRKAREDAKSRKEAFARFRLADAMREQRLKNARGTAYVPPGMRAPWAANSKRRRALGKSAEEVRADELRRMHDIQPTDRRTSHDYSDINAVRARHRSKQACNTS